MSGTNSIRWFIWFPLLFLLQNISYGQNQPDPEIKVRQSINDSLYKKYLSDTLNAATKIRELVQSAIDEPSDPSSAVLKFQLGLALAPYANDSPQVLAMLYAQFSTWLFNAGAADLAIQYGKTALDHGTKMGEAESDHTMIYHLKSRVASFYMGSRQFDSSKKYFSLALEEARLITDPIWEASAINNTGYLYESMGYADSALQFFHAAKARLPLVSRADSDLLGGIQDNIAENYFFRKDIKAAIALYRNNEPLYTALQNYQKVVQAKLGISKCLLAEKKYNAALEQLREIEELAIQSKELRLAPEQIKILNGWKTYYMATGEWQTAFKYQQRMAVLNNSLDKLNKSAIDHIVRASTENEVAKADKEILLQKTLVSRAIEKAWQNLVITMMVSLLFIAIVVLLVFYFRNKNRLLRYEQDLTQKELENKKLLQEKLEQELKFKKGDLQDLGVYLSRIKDLHETITGKLKDVKSRDPRLQENVLKEILKVLDGKTDLQERAELIQQNIDKVNREFYTNLITKYPALSKSEVELCGLLKLNLSNKEIGALKNISAESVKMARNRLRKKLRILPEEDIYAFIAKIDE